MNCPVCAKPMELRDLTQRRLYHRCFDHGLFISLSFFKWFKGAGHIAQNLLQARRTPMKSKDQSLHCPQCRIPMIITPNEPGGTFEVDQCLKCNSVWYDVGEMEKVKERGELLTEFPAAELKRRSMPLKNSPDLLKVGDHGDWHPMMLFGLPIEEDHHGTRNVPVMMWLMIAFSFFVTLMALRSPDFMTRYLFYPQQPLAHYGMNLVISSLMHGGWMHLLGNMYFLLIVGDNIEEKDGPLKLFWLFWVACVAGNVLSMKMGMERPSLGASGGISGLLVYYILMFPENRFRVGFFRGFRFGGGFVTLSISAFGFLVWWGVLQGVGAAFQVQGFGNTGYFAHIGGALVGALAYFLREKG